MSSAGSYKNMPTMDSTTPRDIESWALIQSARELHQAQQNPDNLEAFRSAINTNMVLWTVFQDAVLDSGSPLPFEIRNNLLNLSRFIDKHTMQCLGSMDPKDLDILISINQNIAAGLSEKPDAEASANNQEHIIDVEPDNDDTIVTDNTDPQAIPTNNDFEA